MEHDDREYTDMLNDELKDVEPGAGLHGKVRDGIARNIVRVHRRNTALGAVAVAIVLTMALSTVTPVFGRNGTLPQVIAAMAAERQAEKMSRTLGAAPVQQTGTALQTSVATVQAVSDSALSETDGILALVIAERANKPVADVLKMRTDGLGWGLIMAQLNVSGRDIGEAMSQAETVAVASSPSAASQGQGATSKPAVSNKDGDKVVVNGEITGVSTTLITVAGKTFGITSETQLKYHGKAITSTEIAAKLSVGKLYATVQGTQLADTSLRAALIIVQDGADVQDTPSDEDTDEQGTQSVSNEQQARGKVTAVTATMLRVDGFANDIVLNADTKVEQVGAGKMDLTGIKVGQTVQVHVRLSGTTYTAQQVHIEDKYVKPDTASNEGNDQQGTQPASNEQQIRGNVTFVSPALLQISGFVPGIVLNADTKVEQVGAGTMDMVAIKVGQTVQVHVRLSGTTYTAQQVHIEDKYVKPSTAVNEQPTGTSVTTWQGTIVGISSDLKFIIVTTEASPPATVMFRILATSVLQDAKHKTVTFASLVVGQKVTITGKVLADGSAEVVKLILTTGTSATPQPENPGKGNGKH
ncbi:MAG: hypothetical protein C0398_01430 [Coprothermobacter sp.]|nr:hypothetical protein [Coprothermobacter sp.]